MEISTIRRNTNAIEAGEWVSEIPNMDDVRLRVRGLSSPTVVAVRSRKERKVSRAGRERDGTLKPDVALTVLGEVLFEAVLLDWDGITQDGKPLPYDPVLAKQWLTSRDFVAFADAVTWAAQYVDRAVAETKEVSAGNS